MKLSENELQQLAAHLKCPDGDEGLKVAEMMNSSNANVIAKSIKALNISTGDTILEAGPGNAAHVSAIIGSVPEIVYEGIDISPTMVKEAQERYKLYGNINFRLSGSGEIPFENSFFTKALTVNTIYFWEDARAYANEIARVLKKGGLAVIGFRPKNIMEKMPFTKYGFTMFEPEDVRELMAGAGLEFVSETIENEYFTAPNGNEIESGFAVSVFKKV